MTNRSRNRQPVPIGDLSPEFCRRAYEALPAFLEANYAHNRRREAIAEVRHRINAAAAAGDAEAEAEARHDLGEIVLTTDGGRELARMEAKP